MRTLRGLVLACAVFLPIGLVHGDARDDAAKLLVGKWETRQKLGEREASLMIVFEKDGKLSLKLSGPTDLTLNGTYKLLDENTLEMTAFLTDDAKVEKVKFKVSRDTLELIGEEKETRKLSRAK
jgi:uncharacterized protein (TIGR03066 family)